MGRVEASSGFVEEDYRRAANECHGNTKPSQHPAAILTRALLEALGELAELRDLHQATWAGSLQHTVNFQVLSARQHLEDDVLLRADAHQIAAHLVCADAAASGNHLRPPANTGILHQAPGWQELATEHRDGRRLAGTIVAEQAVDLAGADVQVQAVHRLALLVVCLCEPMTPKPLLPSGAVILLEILWVSSALAGLDHDV
mmetsp:Transcript_97512/g.246015  ORF Transcript_97512/g.246015 Transcript_97512/m.246015 type:complete len:201 (-) Transcript_97512:59-661(-)